MNHIEQEGLKKKKECENRRPSPVALSHLIFPLRSHTNVRSPTRSHISHYEGCVKRCANEGENS